MKTQLLSTLQTLKSVHRRSKATKYDSLLSNTMDLPVENAFCNAGDDVENEFTNGSCSNQGETFEAKQSGNVNSSPQQWPFRHNNDNDSPERRNSYSCNGFPQARKQRYTYKGRISRIPSRYLDTDSDSGDGSVRKDGQSRLKIKRNRRMTRKLPCSTDKLLANGFKQREDAFVLSVKDLEVGAIADEHECFASVDYPDVFENTSPISNGKISHVAHETLDGNEEHQNHHLSNNVMCSETSQALAASSEDVGVDNFVSKSKQKAQHSLTSSCCCCVDISSKNNASVCFECSGEENTAETHHRNEQSLETFSATRSHTPCKRKSLLQEDSSATQTVSPIGILKDSEVSCAIHNGNKKCNNCVKNNEYESCAKISSGIRNKFPKKKRLVKSTNRSSDELALNDSVKNSGYNLLLPRTEGLKDLKDLKMRKAFAKKLKQKQLRRSEKTEKNDVLKRNRKNGFICKVKEKVLGKLDVGKMVKKTNKVNRNCNKGTKIKAAGAKQPSQNSQDLDRVLGMRQSATAVYEFLVQWQNGTSCWVSSEDVVADKHNHYLREYLVENEQDVSVVNRVPFQAYCCDSLSLKECRNVPKSKRALRKMLCVEGKVEKTVCKPPVTSPKKQQNDVAVEYEENICYVTINRETCKRKNTCLKIMKDLITALEDAATSNCEAVVVHGLQSEVLCGLKLDDMSKTGVEKENLMLSQARYLVQTLTNYPKLLIALVSQPCQGITAMLLSLFDMICDKETWENEQILDGCEKETKKVYTLPRLTGHSLLGEEILMGKRNEDLERCDHISACNVDRGGTSAVSSTLAEIEATLTNLGKKTPLLRFTGEISELFPSAGPSFALFSDIESDVFSEYGGCLNAFAEQGSVGVANNRNSSERAVDETSKDSESKQHSENLSGANGHILLPMEHSLKANDHTHHLAVDSVIHSITDESTAEKTSGNQIATDKVTQGDPSRTEPMKQTTFESAIKCINIDDPGIDNEGALDTSGVRDIEVKRLECTASDEMGKNDGEDIAMDATTIRASSLCHQRKNDLSEEAGDSEMFESAVTEKTSKTSTETESTADNALIIEHSIDSGTCHQNPLTHRLVEFELGKHAADECGNDMLANGNDSRTRSNHIDGNLEDATITIDSNEHNLKDAFIKDMRDDMCGTHLRTGHVRTDEFDENQHVLSTVENDMSKKCLDQENTANEKSPEYGLEMNITVIKDYEDTICDNEDSNANVTYASDSFEMTEKRKLNNQINEFITVDNVSSNDIKRTIRNDDTNCYQTTNVFMADPVPVNLAQQGSTNDSYFSSAAADERYLRHLEAEIEAEKAQTKRLLGKFSRLWDNPFLHKNNL